MDSGKIPGGLTSAQRASVKRAYIAASLHSDIRKGHALVTPKRIAAYLYNDAAQRGDTLARFRATRIAGQGGDDAGAALLGLGAELSEGLGRDAFTEISLDTSERHMRAEVALVLLKQTGIDPTDAARRLPESPTRDEIKASGWTQRSLELAGLIDVVEVHEWSYRACFGGLPAGWRGDLCGLMDTTLSALGYTGCSGARGRASLREIGGRRQWWHFFKDAGCTEVEMWSHVGLERILTKGRRLLEEGATPPSTAGFSTVLEEMHRDDMRG